MSKQTLHILLIEDDTDDVELLKEAFTTNGIPFIMDVISEGDRVTPYLENVGAIPTLIVMDLNLPKTSGKEIMKLLKDSAVFKSIPLIVFSTSSAKEDIKYAYSMGADKFITKPVTMEGWDATAIAMEQIASQN